MNIVQSYRFEAIEPETAATVTAMLAREPGMTVGMVADTVARCPVKGLAITCSMMVARLLSIDLRSAALSRASRVIAVPPCRATDLPDLTRLAKAARA